MPKAKQKREGVADIIHWAGAEVRQRINKLPKKDQTLAWGCVAAMVATAGMHDSDNPDQIVGIVTSAIEAMYGSLAIEEGQKNA